MILSKEAQNKISRQSVRSNELAYVKICEMEIELEERLDAIREIKAFILVDIELKTNGRK